MILIFALGTPSFGGEANGVMTDGIEAPVSAPAVDPNVDPVCLEELTSFDPAPVTEVASVMAAVKLACETETSCGNLALKKVLEEAINQHGRKHRGFWKRVFFYPRRIAVPLIYIGSVVGPPILTLFLTSKFQLPQDYKIVLSGAVGAASGFLLGRFGSSLERMVGPHLEQLAMTIWDPHDNDSWGRIQKALNEKDRLINSQVYNQLLTADRQFELAGKMIRDIVALPKEEPNYIDISIAELAKIEAVDPVLAEKVRKLTTIQLENTEKIEDERERKLALAADQYALALLHSYNLFGGLHYYHPNMVAAVRTHLPRSGQFREYVDLSEEFKVELIIRVCRTLQAKSRDEVPDSVNRDELVRFAFGVMLRWLVVHDHPEGQIKPGGGTAAATPVSTQPAVPGRLGLPSSPMAWPPVP